LEPMPGPFLSTSIVDDLGLDFPEESPRR
jgi:hypothetical protein